MVMIMFIIIKKVLMIDGGKNIIIFQYFVCLIGNQCMEYPMQLSNILRTIMHLDIAFL